MTGGAALGAGGAMLLAAALLALLRPARGQAAMGLAQWVVVAGCAIGAAGAGSAALSGVGVDAGVPWPPFGSLAVHLDALAGLFLLPILVIGGLGALYGGEYLSHVSHPALGGGHSSRMTWCWYALFVLSMSVVVVAANAVLFLIAWEAMSVFAFLLVTHEDEDAEVRHAGWVFLVAAHIGTAFLLAMFAILGRGAATMDFAALDGADTGRMAGAVVLLGIIGFGMKAGLAPGHIWLPIVHPAAPSHVSALMSGAMLNVGVYGLLRVLGLLPAVPVWTGAVLLALGLGSALYGVLLALAQHDLKRLLAFSSVENMGIVCAALGIALLGRAYGLDGVAVLGMAGALLHVLNHSLFKSLWFLNAGAVQRAAGTREIDQLGGLLKALPWTGATSFAGAAAICALPPFNGFAGELLIYLAAASGIGAAQPALAAAFAASIGMLALTGGLAVACFTKAFGAVFLGLPRRALAWPAAEGGRWMRWPPAALAVVCLGIGLVPVAGLRLVQPAASALSGVGETRVDVVTAPVVDALMRVSLLAAIVVGLAGVLAWWRSRMLRTRVVAEAPTWGTAYLAPSARMQYTGSSFVAPITTLFRGALRMEIEPVRPAGYFPAPVSYATRARGLIREPIIEPFFRATAEVAMRLRWLQHGRIQLYLANIAGVLLALLIWKLGV